MSLLLHVESRDQGKPFCAGLVLDDEDDRVIATAPALRFMELWTLNQVMFYCNKHGWKIDSRGERLE